MAARRGRKRRPAISKSVSEIQRAHDMLLGLVKELDERDADIPRHAHVANTEFGMWLTCSVSVLCWLLGHRSAFGERVAFIQGQMERMGFKRRPAGLEEMETEGKVQ